MTHKANIDDVIDYWIKSSNQDFETAKILFKNKKYHHALFFCHISIEKMLKALIVKKTKSAPPFVHDLVRLYEKADVGISNDYRDDFAEISTFNIEARYDDYKLSFYRRATKNFSSEYINKTQEILKELRRCI